MKNVKKLSKKLILGKTTVTNLNNSELNAVNGGVNSGLPTCTNTREIFCDTYDPFHCVYTGKCPTTGSPTNDPEACTAMTCPGA